MVVNTNVMGFQHVLLLSLVGSILVNSVQGLSVDMAKRRYAEILMECSQYFPINNNDLEMLKNLKMPDNPSAKCLFACAYKKIGMMDEQGYLSTDRINAISQELFQDDPVNLQKAYQFTEICKYVNQVSVSDGSNGCERAAYIFKCTVENAPPGLL